MNIQNKYKASIMAISKKQRIELAIATLPLLTAQKVKWLDRDLVWQEQEYSVGGFHEDCLGMEVGYIKYEKNMCTYRVSRPKGQTHWTREKAPVIGKARMGE